MVYLEYKGINTNNLKNINIKIEKNKIICITGPSGSGKSSLAFDTIYQISQSELNQLYGYDNFHNEFSIQEYRNIIPSVALEQNNYNNNPRSTIATYYGIDKLFSKMVSLYNNVPFHRFSFNKLESACKKCKGLGYEFNPDIIKILDYDSTIKDIPFINWRNSEVNYYKQLIEQYCNEINICIDKKFRDLDDIERHNLLYGVSSQKYKIDYKQSGRKRVKTDFYKGPMLRLGEKINKNSLENREIGFIKKEKCSVCNGYRFSNKILKYKLFGKNLGEIYTMELYLLKEWLLQHKNTWEKELYCKSSIEIILNFIDKLTFLKLGYLNLNRAISSLSGGELQRLRLSKILSTQFNNILYVLDEPSAGLHPSEYNSIAKCMLSVIDKENTILFIDHNSYFLDISDNIIALGPKAGKDGGFLVDSVLYRNNSIETIAYKFFQARSYIHIENERYNNIESLSICIPIKSMIGICGVSGSGKTSFVKGILPKYLENLIYTNQKPISGNVYSVVATYTDIMSNIKTLFSKENNVDESMFSFYVNSKGACSACNGKGYITYQSKFDDTFSYRCPECEGKRFNNGALEYTFKNLNIYELLNKTVDELIETFKEVKGNIIDTLIIMKRLGLGYITLLQGVQSLSGGESQRLKLVKALKSKRKDRYIVLDEPFKGLSSNDISNIIKFLYEIVEGDSTVIIVEHNAFALSHCSYLIEFGPESGIYGGKIIYSGNKNGIKDCKESKTRNFLI
ncbi:ATP-binding cassette domain-containing protein [Asaccharospora irregularis]|uniref:UvrABC system protein A n=1 Tax=Asaccharospora irregularis DSM 2635 TaxID=1121321 RepID=A0A1M5TG45_9FIRM|nr:ATP-binding cassette domain-containing protein [Asaccharospora irregularis]SHH49333.1 Excinuclease UvrABC ATPase subunit [Asaccharospora irregularis DSM 2635]